MFRYKSKSALKDVETRTHSRHFNVLSTRGNWNSREGELRYRTRRDWYERYEITASGMLTVRNRKHPEPHRKHRTTNAVRSSNKTRNYVRTRCGCAQRSEHGRSGLPSFSPHYNVVYTRARIARSTPTRSSSTRKTTLSTTTISEEGIYERRIGNVGS